MVKKFSSHDLTIGEKKMHQRMNGRTKKEKEQQVVKRLYANCYLFAHATYSVWITHPFDRCTVHKDRIAFQIDAVEREPSMMITTILYCFTSFKTSFSFRLGILLYFFLSLPWLKTTLSTYQTYGYLILNIRLSLLPSFFPLLIQCIAFFVVFIESFSLLYLQMMCICAPSRLCKFACHFFHRFLYFYSLFDSNWVAAVFPFIIIIVVLHKSLFLNINCLLCSILIAMNRSDF